MADKSKLKERSEISADYKWHIEDIFADSAAWEAEFAELEASLEGLAALKETALNSAEALRDALDKLGKASLSIERLYVYARMMRDQDNRVGEAQALADRAQGLMVKLSAATSFMEPMLLSADEALLKEYAADPVLADHDFYLSELLRARKHILSEREEEMLSLAGEFSGGAKEIFTMLNNADLKFASIEHNGETIEISHASYIALMQEGDRELREKVYNAYYAAFRQHINTIAATYSTSVKKDVYFAKVRGYESALSASLFGDNVPMEVYDSLIEQIHENLPTLHRYMAIRKRVLGVDKLGMHDIYVPLVAEADNDFSYERAKEMVIEGLAPLGEQYIEILKGAFEKGWIDVYENVGKTTGAYSWGPYGTHPYVLLNHRGDLDSVFTIAHELGHAMHSYLSDAAQPYSKAGYAIFVAEVASTVNEILLTKHLLATLEDKELKKYVLNHFIEQFRTTVIRQTMFAEFEKKAHEMAEQGVPLTAESLSKMYGELNALYHGEEVVTDDNISAEWARIPHFYNAFYVYKYATGFSSASAIVRNLKNEGARDAYLNMLSLGGSNHPIELLKGAGVDFDNVVKQCMAEFAAAIDEFEKLV